MTMFGSTHDWEMPPANPGWARTAPTSGVTVLDMIICDTCNIAGLAEDTRIVQGLVRQDIQSWTVCNTCITNRGFDELRLLLIGQARDAT